MGEISSPSPLLQRLYPVNQCLFGFVPLKLNSGNGCDKLTNAKAFYGLP